MQDSKSDDQTTDDECLGDWILRQMKERKVETTENVWNCLLQHALAVNDALRFHPDHVEYTGSINLAEDFRRVVNHAWHMRSGMVEAGDELRKLAPDSPLK